MAKKILILLVVALVCFASFKTFALDITNDEDFSEVSTDYSFLLDSPLFTQQEDLENNNTNIEKIVFCVYDDFQYEIYLNKLSETKDETE